jgi:predicted kinase
MRDLILLRGAPGSGKSTWVKEHHLEPYTVSSDQVRLMVSCPEADPQYGDPHIPQRNDQTVWQFIEQVVELRMRMGQFIVLDAQNIHPSRWKKLAELYRYRIYVKEFDVPVDECLRRNAQRPVLQRVPEHVIMASCWKIGNNSLPNSYKSVTDDIANGDLAPLDVNS